MNNNGFEMAARVFGFAGASSEAMWGARLMMTGTPIGIFAGSLLLAKAFNDYQESIWDRDGYARRQIGAHAYNAIDAALIFYSVTRAVPRINPYGNKYHDFYIKDYLFHEPAYKQFGRFEILRIGTDVGLTAKDDLDRHLLEIGWQEHLNHVENSFK